MRVAALLVAAGPALRSEVGPGPLTAVGGRPLVCWAAEALAPDVDALQPVGEAASLDPALAGTGARPAVPGGATWHDSVRLGLEALAADAPDVVVLHDAARPVIPPGTVAALIEALGFAPGAIPAVPVGETLKRATNGQVEATVPGGGLVRAQTPQAFRFPLLLRLHRAAAGGAGAVDDAALLEAAGHAVVVVPGSEANIRITCPEDLVRLAPVPSPALLPRTGTGFDVHVLAPGRPLVLCGLAVPHDQGLAGHSDADVGIHALCDAIYGALAEGDIGRHFPPSEATWKDADSARFLRHAAERIAARGGRLANADVTLICEHPKITPHAPAMTARLAALLGVEAGRVSVKATTTERLGFAGRGEGIAAQAVATVLLPE